MEIDELQLEEKIKETVEIYLKSSAFTDRKLTDTPTDDLQVVNKRYCDSNSVTDATLSFSDITTNNASTSKHGFLPKLSGNSYDYLDGNGNWNLPQYLTGIAGEDLLAKDAVFISNFTGDNTILDTTSSGADAVFGQTSSFVRTAQTFSFPTSTQLISKITVRLKKSGTPTDDVVITLRDGLDGTIIQTIGTVAGGTITGSYADYSFTLTDFICAQTTSYTVQMARSGSLDDANYYRWQASTGNPYPNGFGANFDGSVWASNQADRQMIFQMTTASGNIYKCRTDVSGFYEMFNGFVKTGVSKDATVTVNIGMQQTLSGMTGRTQYLTDSPGLISATPGTNLKEVGVAFSATALELSPMYLRNYTSGISSINSSTTTNIAHGLGIKPRFVRITAYSGSTTPVSSIGVYNGRTTSTVYYQQSGASGAATDSTNIIYNQITAGNSLVATITTDATNLILVSTLSGTCTATFMWEAFS